MFDCDEFMIFPIRVPLASNRVRYGIVLFLAVSIIFFSVVNPADIQGESTDGEEVYGPFGIDYGPLGWFESDTWAHCMGYGLFTATLAYAFVAPVRAGRRRRLALCVCFAVAFGGCMELVQGTIPYRGMSGIEVIADAIGACLVAAVWWGMSRTVLFGDGGEVPI